MVKEINIYDAEVLFKTAVPCVPKTTSLTGMLESKNNYWPDEVVDLVNDLKDTALHNKNSVGLSSNQIWDKDSNPLAVFVIAKIIKNEEGKLIKIFQEYINPKIISNTGMKIAIEEGCLSIPNYTKKIKRKANIEIEFQTLESEKIYREKFFGSVDLTSIIIQHEYDHLHGILIKKSKTTK